MTTIHFVDNYLTGVDESIIDTGGLPDGVTDGARVWATTINAPSADNGINSLLCIAHADSAWDQLDPATDDGPPWDFVQDLVYARATNTLGSLRLFNDSEWRIVAVNG